MKHISLSFLCLISFISHVYPQAKLGLGIMGGGKVNLSYQELPFADQRKQVSSLTYVGGFHLSYMSKDERHILTTGIYKTAFNSSFLMNETSIFPPDIFPKVRFSYKGWQLPLHYQLGLQQKKRKLGVYLLLGASLIGGKLAFTRIPKAGGPANKPVGGKLEATLAGKTYTFMYNFGNTYQSPTLMGMTLDAGISAHYRLSQHLSLLCVASMGNGLVAISTIDLEISFPDTIWVPEARITSFGTHINLAFGMNYWLKVGKN